MSEIEITTSMEFTPELMAEQFWNMGSDQQAEFFHHLADIVEKDHETNPNSYSLGEMQWLYMADEIKKHSQQAYKMYLSFCAFAYEHFKLKESY